MNRFLFIFHSLLNYASRILTLYALLNIKQQLFYVLRIFFVAFHFQIFKMFAGGIQMQDTKIGELIKNRRKELGMSSVVLANRVGVNQSTISRWESGQIKDIRRAQIYLLSKYLYIPVETILGLSEETTTEDMEIISRRLRLESKLESIKDKETLDIIENFINAYCTAKGGKRNG